MAFGDRIYDCAAPGLGSQRAEDRQHDSRTTPTHSRLPESSPRLHALGLFRASARRHRDIDVVQGGHDLDAVDHRKPPVSPGRHACAGAGALAVDRPADFPLELVLNGLAAQTGRRFIKTHLPLDGLPYRPDVQYVVVGRDARDVFMSLLNHWGNHTPAFYQILNTLPGRVGDPMPQYVDDIPARWRSSMIPSSLSEINNSYHLSYMISNLVTSSCQHTAWCTLYTMCRRSEGARCVNRRRAQRRTERPCARVRRVPGGRGAASCQAAA